MGDCADAVEFHFERKAKYYYLGWQFFQILFFLYYYITLFCYTMTSVRSKYQQYIFLCSIFLLIPTTTNLVLVFRRKIAMGLISYLILNTVFNLFSFMQDIIMFVDPSYLYDTEHTRPEDKVMAFRLTLAHVFIEALSLIITF